MAKKESYKFLFWNLEYYLFYSRFKMIGENEKIVGEWDAAGFVDNEFYNLGDHLPDAHPFKQLLKLFRYCMNDESWTSISKVESIPEDKKTVIVTPDQLEIFHDYIHGDLNRQWDELFLKSPRELYAHLKIKGVSGPIRRLFLIAIAPGYFTFTYMHMVKRINGYKNPSAREIYIDIMKLLRQALASNCKIVRERY